MELEAAKIQKRLDQLEAERLILTIELRNSLLRAANELLPEAIRQAKPKPKKGKRTARAGSPALLRLLTRFAMRPIQIERPKP